jgi:hypothetical protein
LHVQRGSDYPVISKRMRFRPPASRPGGSVSLPAREQQVLNGIETVLQDSEATLTAMFGLFTRLAGGEEKPRAEELGLAPLRTRPPRAAGRLPPRAASGLSRNAGRLSPGAGRWLPGEWRRVVILLAMLVAAAGAAVILSTTASPRTCGPATATGAYGVSFSPAPSCSSSPTAPTPTQLPRAAPVRQYAP